MVNRSTPSSKPLSRTAFRLTLGVLLLILLLPLPLLAGHSSTAGSILGRYTRSYAAMLAVYGLGLLVLVALIVTAPRPARAVLKRLLGWLQRYPLLWLVLFLAMVVVWYALRDALRAHRFFFSEDYRVFLGIVGDRELVPLTLTLAVLELYSMGVIIFVGRTGADLKNVLANVLLAGFSLSLTFVVFSFLYAYVIRAPDYVVGHQMWWELHQPDPLLGYKMRPNQHIRLYVEGADRFITVTTDDRGFRNLADRTAAPIALIGDSFVFGLPLDDGELWASTLESELGMEAANYGVTGYEFWQYNRVAEQFVAPIHPDLVVYALYANDLKDESAVEADPRLQLHWEFNRHRNPVNFTVNALLHKSPALALIDSLRQPTRRASTVDAGTTNLPYGMIPICVPEASPAGAPLDYLTGEMDRAIALSQANGYRLLFVTVPTRDSIYEELLDACGEQMQRAISVERQTYTALCAYADAQGVPCFDLTAEFKQCAEQADDALYLTYDVHWNPAGQAAFAEMLADHIREANLLK